MTVSIDLNAAECQALGIPITLDIWIMRARCREYMIGNHISTHQRLTKIPIWGPEC